MFLEAVAPLKVTFLDILLFNLSILQNAQGLKELSFFHIEQ